MAGQETATLYLRGVPRELVREAKAEAARRGISLTAFAKESLAKALGRSGEDDEVRSIRPDLEWFEANRLRLARRYRGEYVAIVGKKVVDHDASFSALAQRVFTKYGVRPIAMPKVTTEKRVLDVPTPFRAAAQ